MGAPERKPSWLEEPLVREEQGCTSSAEPSQPFYIVTYSLLYDALYEGHGCHICQELNATGGSGDRGEHPTPD